MSGVTRQSILSEVGDIEIDVINKHGDRYATFPYVTTTTWKNAVVYRHVDIRDEALNAFVSDVSQKEIDETFVLTSVVASLIRKKTEKLESIDLEDIYRELSSGDKLCQKVFDDIENQSISGKDGGFLLDAIRSGDMFTDIARVNGLRLAANVAMGDEDLRDRFEHSAKFVLNETMDLGLERYNRTLNAIARNSPLEAAKLFAGSFPVAVIGFAFPMNSNEADSYLQMF
jgi:hypothetical protein